MSGGVSFKINASCEIVSWGNKIAHLTSIPRKKALGKKYFEIFPRLCGDDGRDIVESVINRKKPLKINGFKFRCIGCSESADIRLSPLNSGEIKITIVPGEPCRYKKELETSKDFIHIGKIASTLSHGVRNSLNAITGAVVYIKEKYSTETSLIDFARIIEDEIKKLERQINNFLSTSLTELDLKKVDINALLKKLEVFTSYQTMSRNINTSYSYGILPEIELDVFRIEQALLNIINNAIDAMPQGGRLSIETSLKRRKKKEYICIVISDTGHGMSKETIKCIKSRYISKERTKGRGYGLTIANEIITSHGGFLDIKSKNTQGTKVSIFLPVKRGE